MKQVTWDVGKVSEETGDILSLLTAMILADKRILSEEIKAFLESAERLTSRQSFASGVTDSHLLSWYETNRDHINRKIHSPYFKSWFYECLERLSDIKDKQPILEAMHVISKSDGEIHVSERALMTLAARYWEVDRVSSA